MTEYADMPHGGARPGAGRKPLPESLRRCNVTVKIRPSADKRWAQLAEEAHMSKGGVVEWLTEDERAEAARILLKQGSAPK
jgi:hypothetical protein